MNTPEELDVIVIGAGLSGAKGICALISTIRRLPGTSIAVFDKSDSVGGTWAKNTYPGLRCDIPSKLYSYSFALKPDWRNEYATQPEILSYIRDVVSFFRVSDHIHLQQEVEGAEWLDDKSQWRVYFVDGDSGKRYIKHSRFLITAVGFCNLPNEPDGVQNIEAFQGRLFHSSNWDHSMDFRDKHVLVIGNGCSANQFIPHLISEASVRSLTQVVRSSHWVAPKQSRSIPEWERLMRNFPGAAWLARFSIATKLDFAFSAFKTNLIGELLRKALQSSIASYMRQQSPSKYHDILIPDFDFGAKRPVLDHGYLSALHDDRLTLLRSASLTVTGASEVQTADGEKVHADIIIMANGFRTQELLTPMVIEGRMGVKLPDVWHQGGFASAYMGVCVAGFPNLFLLTGPNTLPSGHSTLSVFGTFAGTRVEVSAAAQTLFNEWIQAKMKQLVYTADVRSWYVDRRSGQNTLIWPGSQLSFWWSRCVKKPQWGDFEIKRR
ncbi:hypothetical protein K4F52_009760 [Lecanicillium sp. MT-2017a]|nr:hypothetical protein K4F52_009760 [Lecanicillium sp. MT-2017a]